MGWKEVARRFRREEVFAYGGEAGLRTPHWTAFYADCLHELCPITSGHRVALVYHLVCTTGSHLTPDRRIILYSEVSPAASSPPMV